MATLIYRVVREGLRNVENNAEAQRVVVTVVERGGMVDLLLTTEGLIEHDASRTSHFAPARASCETSAGPSS